MLCIASFIIFLILGIFSATYRDLARKAWYCVGRRVTFRPCDINFDVELRGKLIGSLMRVSPGLARFVHRWGDVLAFFFVLTSLWSVVAVGLTGLNLYVYDTCSPADAESCSLGGEACGVGIARPNFWESVQQGRVVTWVVTPWQDLGTTLSRVPDRWRVWQARDFTENTSSYYRPFDEQKSVVLEVIDPGCKFCAKLTKNIKEAQVGERYNLTYLLYPIADGKGGQKFPQSMLMARYVIATSMISPSKNISDEPADWQLLSKVLLETDRDGVAWQDKFNLYFNEEAARQQLGRFLVEIGYDEVVAQQIAELAESEEVTARLAQQRETVEQKIRTIKIPTLLIDGRRYDRVVGVDQLQ